MEKTYNAALIRRVQEYMEKHSISQNQLAAKVNLSSAALSSYLNQKYKGSVEAVERQLTEFFKINDEVAAVAEKVGGLLPGNRMCPLPSARMCTRASVLPSWNTAWWFCTAMQALAKARVPRSF